MNKNRIKTSKLNQRSEEALQAVSSRYEAILAAVPDIIMEVDTNKIYTWANQAGFDFFGENVLGKEASLYFEGEQDTYEKVQLLFDGDENMIYLESWQRRKDGEKRLLAWWCRVLKDANGNVKGAISTARDITERKQIEKQLRFQNQLFEKTIESLSHPFYVIDANNYKIKMANTATTIFSSISEDTTCHALTHNSKKPCRGMRHTCPLEEVKRTKKPVALEHIHYDKDGNARHFEIHAFPIFDDAGNVVQMIEYSLDITERKQAEQELRKALEVTRQRQAEVSALLEGSRAVLQHREFEDAARSIFYSFKNLIGATAGYIALLNKEETENELLFLDSGGLECTVDPSLPMPIRGLRQKAFRTGQTVCENDFEKSEWVKFLPQGHAPLRNVLFAPLKLDGKVIGLLGVANKSGGFTENDVRMATAFGELASVALINSRSLESLEASEKRFRSITQTASDAIITINGQGKITYWNNAAENIFDYSRDEICGEQITLIMPDRFRDAHQKGLNRVLSTGKSRLLGKTYEMVGLRKDGSEFPIELSISSWKTKDEPFFTGIVRDVTERKQMVEELKESHDLLETRVKERTAELMKTNKALRTEIAEHKRTEKKLLDYQQKLRSLASELTLTEERQRRRIATDLHDSIGQALAISNMKLSAIRTSKSDPEFEKELDDIYGLLKQTIQNTRTLTFELSPPILYELGLESAVEWLTEKFHEQHGIQTNFIDDGNPKPLSNDIRIVLFRTVRELLFNIVKHADAKNVTVSMERENSDLRIRITDDGIGFDLSDFDADTGKRAGFGIFSIREQLDFLGGHLEIKSKPGRGTCITLAAPLNV